MDLTAAVVLYHNKKKNARAAAAGAATVVHIAFYRKRYSDVAIPNQVTSDVQELKF